MIVAGEIHHHAPDEWNGILNVPCNFETPEGSGIGR